MSVFAFEYLHLYPAQYQHCENHPCDFTIIEVPVCMSVYYFTFGVQIKKICNFTWLDGILDDKMLSVHC